MKIVTKIVWITVILTCGVCYGNYLDAEGGPEGNTVRAADDGPDAWWTAATASDGVWGLRTGFANNATVYESSGTDSGVENSMTIVTTISGLAPGRSYEVKVVYWSSETQNWCIRAGFNPAGMSLYDRTGDNAEAGTTSGVTEGDRLELLATIGTIQADENGQIKVYIDDKPSDSSQGGWYDRTWYDGLLYEEIDTGCADLLYDLTGPEGLPDCKVNFYDFTKLAAHWLECSLIPQSACYE